MDLYSWHKIDVTGLANDNLTEMKVGGKRIGLLKRHGTIHAFTAACPHAGASLCDGWLDPQGRIVCPEHKYRFDPQTGRNTTGEGYKLFMYPIEIRDNEVYVGFLP